MTTTILDNQSTVGARRVDISKGTVVTDVSAQWWKRPDDERFTDLDSLHQQVTRWWAESREERFAPDEIRIAATEIDDTERQRLEIMVGDLPVAPSSYAFEQLCGLAGSSARFIGGRLTPEVAALALEDSLGQRDKPMVAYLRQPEKRQPTLRALTSESYARIPDHLVVEQARQLADLGGWKVPGVMDWGTMIYNPHVAVTKDTTTLFASDRDVFMFLCDDLHPIEVGKTKDGSPDYMFRGFYAHNSEVGAYALKIGTMYLRGICQNRCLWGVEGLEEVYIRHVGSAPERFLEEAMPKLRSYAEASDKKLIAGVAAAKATSLRVDDDDDRQDVLRRLGFSKRAAEQLMTISIEEEGTPINTVWDAAQAITALARDIPHQDERLVVERRAKALLDDVTVA